MKTIYTFSLDEDIPESIDLIERIKVLCYFIYDDLRVRGYDSPNSIICTEGIIPNQLMETTISGKYYYRFKYENYGPSPYDPFMITDTSFAFTINSDTISYDELVSVVNNAKQMINFNYNITIKSYSYLEDNANNNRQAILERIFDDNLSRIDNNKPYTKTLRPIKVAI